MNAPIRFDLWQKRRPSIETKRNRKSITLAPFSANCGLLKGSLEVTVSAALNAHIVASLTDSICSMECWYKITSTSSGATAGLMYIATSEATLGTPLLGISISPVTKEIFLNVQGSSGVVDYATGIYTTYSVWHHYAVTRDYVTVGTLTTLKLYLDGVLRFTVSSAALPHITPTGGIAGCGIVIGNWSGVETDHFGYAAHLRMWSIALSAEQVVANYNRIITADKPDGGINPYYNSLVACFPFFYQPNLSQFPSEVYSRGSSAFSGDSDEDQFFRFSNQGGFAYYLYTSATEYPSLIYGASFVAAQWDITLSQKTSIKFPVARPSGCTFMLCVRYVDDLGVTQHKKLWDLAGVDIAPAPVMYAGEKLPLNFTLEAWNVDGAVTIELLSDLVLYTGETSIPLTDGDHASQIAMTPVLDTTLAANFPLTPFPVVFNTQQVY